MELNNGLAGFKTSKRPWIFILIAAAFLFLWAAAAQALDVAILFSDSSISELEAVLEADPRIGPVDTYYVEFSAPSVETMNQYDVLFVHTNSWWFQIAETLGNNLADYVDGGGGVVVDVFVTCTDDAGIKGRFYEEGYLPFTSPSIELTIVWLDDYDADHPIMHGITGLAEDMTGLTVLTSGASWVASYNNAHAAIATKQTVAAINALYSNARTDAVNGRVAVNAVLWAWAEATGSYCEIEGRQYLDGQINLENTCEICDISQSTVDWTYLGDGAACEDDLFCTGTDTCGAGTCSIHSGDPCAPGYETCNEDYDRCDTIYPEFDAAPPFVEESVRPGAPVEVPVTIYNRADACFDLEYSLAWGGDPTFDTVGGTSQGSGKTNYTVGNFYACSSSRILTEVLMYLKIYTGTEAAVTAAVYEGTELEGSYVLIDQRTRTLAPTDASGWYVFDGFRTPLESGRYYGIVVSWSSPSIMVYYESTGDQAVSFGVRNGSINVNEYLPDALTGNSDETAYRQRVLTYQETPWMTASPQSGSVPPGSVVYPSVFLDADSMNPGTYVAQLRIYHNDPEKEVLNVPVTMEVPGFCDGCDIDAEPAAVSAVLPEGSAADLPLIVRNAGSVADEGSDLNYCIEPDLAKRHDMVGGTKYRLSGHQITRGNLYHCGQSRTLAGVRMVLDLWNEVEVTAAVYKGDSLEGEFALIDQRTRTFQADGEGWYTIDEMNTPLEAGGYYWIAFSWDALYLRTYQGYEGYDWTSFGVCHGGFSEAQVLPGTVSPSPTIYPYRQILITRDPVPWLSAPVGSGVLAPGQSDAYQVGLDAQGLPLGSVEANLRIDSDDLDEPRLRVPVILEVVESCAACLIDGACYAQGQTHPADVCLVCDVERSTDSWSDNDGVSCDDWSFCTVDDACAGGQCLGTGRDCDDGLFCTGVESCNEDGDRCESPGDPCPDDGLYCNGSESCDEEGDQCVHSGDPCTQDGVFCNGPEVCDEEGDQCLHAGNPCDDGLYCTGSEPCDEEGDLCPGTHTGDPCKAYECCIEESDTCEQIHFVLHHPDYHVSYPAGGGLEVSYEFSGSCLETVRIGAYFRVDGNPGEYMNLLEDAPPVHTFVWETPVVDWDDVHITYWYPGVGGQMDYFRLHVPHSPSIAYEPIDRETVIQWDGFVSDILVLEGPYDPSFAGADTAEAVTSPWTDADSDAGTAVEKYYRILNAGTQAAAPVDLGRRDVSIRQGYNLLAVPLRYDDELWASEVTADIVAQGGNVIELSKWDSSSGTWKTHDPAWPVVDFTILPGEGFFVRAGADSTWTVVGEVIRDTPVSIDTVYGYAMLGIPTWAYAMASDLAAGMIAQGCDPLEISRWVASAGVWETHDLSWPVVDFGIDAADGYLLRAGADATFVLEPMAVDAAVLSPTEARITFDTDVPGAAFLWVGTDPENLDDHAPDDRNFLFEGTDHVFTLIGLYSGQTYFFEIEFLGRIFRNGGEPYSFEMP